MTQRQDQTAEHFDFEVLPSRTAPFLVRAVCKNNHWRVGGGSTEEAARKEATETLANDEPECPHCGYGIESPSNVT
jgi:hypothetical protein